ncbi:MAG TPA: sugar phosphate isomerase/epimerase family protein [Chthonomonadales bacterium]|nr:sugar phosphate isomerase/epimerase family protein [Chthonomonadales bacterium]
MITTRREAVRLAAATALGAMPVAAAAIDPIRRVGPPRMKLGLAAFSFRDHLTGRHEPRMTLEDFVDRASALGVDAVEPTEYYFPKPVTTEYIARLKRRCFLQGLDISGSPMGNVFTHPAGPARDAQLSAVKAWVDRCVELGAPCVRVFAGAQQPGQTLEQAQRCVIESMEAACEYAGTRGVMLALENHGGIVAEADGLLAIVRAVRSEWCGVNLDTGNFRTDDPYADLAKCARYTVMVQVKTEVQPRGRPRVEADLARKAAILRDAGYRGYVVLEYEAAEPPLTAVPRWLDRLRAVL